MADAIVRIIPGVISDEQSALSDSFQDNLLAAYGPDGLRSILLQKNATAVNKVRALKQQKLDLKISDEEYKKQVSEIKSGKGRQSDSLFPQISDCLFITHRLGCNI